MRNQSDSGSHESLARFRPRRTRRLAKVAIFFFVMAIVVVWFAPQIVLTQPAREWLLSRSLPGSPAQVNWESATLSWLSPIEVNGLTIADEQDVVIAVNRITSTQTLWQMVMHPRELGTIRLEAPTVHVTVGQDGQNNLARLVGDADWASGPDDAATGLPTALKLEVTDGQIRVSDESQRREFAAENTSLFVTLPMQAVEPVHVELSTIALDGGQQGSLAAQLKWWPPQPGQQAGEGTARVQAERFPITLATALAAAAGVQLQGTGLVDANVECDWQEEAQGIVVPVKATLTGTDVAVSLPELKGDRLSSQTIKIDLNALVDGGKLTIDRMHAESDHGVIHASGAAPLSTFGTAADQGLAVNHQLELEGFVDLPVLLTQLRQTLRLRDDAAITEGRAELVLTSSGTATRHTLRGQLRTERLIGEVRGKPIQWNEALTVDISAAQADGKLAIDRAVCQTPFATVEVNGDQTSGNLVAESDLSALVTQLGQFVDFGDWSLGGTASTQGNWRFDGPLLTINLDTDYRHLSIANAGSSLLVEPRLATRADCRVITDGGSIQRVESGAVQVTSGSDQFLLRLKQPVDAPGPAAVWPILCRVTGSLQSWMARTVPDSSWTVAGDLNLEADGWIAGHQIEIPNLVTELRNVVAAAGATQLNEPIVKLQGHLRCNTLDGGLHISQLTGTSAALAINSQDIRLQFPEGKPALSGIFAFRGDVGRLATLLAPGGENRYVGTLEGQVALEPVAETVRVNGTARCQGFAMYARPTVATPAVFVEGRQVGAEQMVWNEQSVDARVVGTWTPRADSIQFEQLKIKADEATVDLRGSVQQLTRRAVADLTGRVQYNLQTVSGKLNADRPTGIVLAGAHEGPLTIQGPLVASPAAPDAAGLGVSSSSVVSTELVAATHLAWDSASLYGVLIGPQQLNVQLNQGVLATSPIDATVSGGQLRARPMIDFRQQPVAVTLAGETVLQNAELTPEFCDQWIKYVAPLLAGTASASGDFTLVLNQTTIPLTNPHMAELAGRLTIGSARVQPGPMARSIYTASQDFTSMLSQSDAKLSFLAPDRSWLELSNQQVDFQMTQGRIYHQNLKIGVGDVEVASRGWVGIDQSVAMVAEIPFQDKWLGSSNLLDGLRGQTIQVPIHGSLTRPQLDRRALTQLSSQLIGNTAERLLDGQLQKGLQKLLGPK